MKYKNITKNINNNVFFNFNFEWIMLNEFNIIVSLLGLNII